MVMDYTMNYLSGPLNNTGFVAKGWCGITDFGKRPLWTKYFMKPFIQLMAVVLNFCVHNLLINTLLNFANSPVK